ncbi:MAG TPA: hypothetical protein VGB68_05550, partial [Pyrinomonadaceae bacterium]
FVFEFKYEPLSEAAIPLKLPRYVYDNVLRLEPIENYATPMFVILFLSLQAINFFIYSIPFYLVFTLNNLYTGKKSSGKTEELKVPPSPPGFEDSK